MLVPQVRVLRLDANLGPGQTPRALTERQLEIVHRFSQVAVFGLADQQMHVLRHDHVAIDAHPETQSHGFQAERKQVVEPGIGKFRFSPIATEGDEVD